MDALRCVDQTATNNLHGMLGLYAGMRGRLTKKIKSLELVQEAPCEVVGFLFHPNERFGDPASSNIRPSDSHPCWLRGWVKCDLLPVHVEVRFDDCAKDYTGLNKPGVWYLEAKEDEWHLKVKAITTVNHPGAPRPIIAQSKKEQKVDVIRWQIPLTFEDDLTFQKAQGTTVRGPELEPKGFVIDLFHFPTMSKEIYFQHVYMILGRARKLEWELLRNFPMTCDGEYDWSVFEEGPPAYLCEFLTVLRERA